MVHFLTQVAFAQWLAPSQTGSSISAWSACLPARWQQRRWGSAEFPWRGTGGGRVSASRQSTGRPQWRESRSFGSTGRHLEGGREKKEPQCQWKTIEHTHQSTSTKHTPAPTWLSVHCYNKPIAAGHQVSHLCEGDRRVAHCLLTSFTDDTHQRGKVLCLFVF